MKNHLFDEYDLMKGTIERLKGVLFCEVGAEGQGEKLSDQEVLSKAACILAEHELIADQIAMKYGRC